MEQVILPPPETQVCKCCGRELPVEQFGRNRFGLLQTCKECMSQKKSEGRKKRDEMDREAEFRRVFGKMNLNDNALV